MTYISDYYIKVIAVFCLVVMIEVSCGCKESERTVPPLPEEEVAEEDKDEEEGKEEEPTNIQLVMVDPNATETTRALYSNLWKIAEKGFMFGHHDDLWYGRYWYNESGRSDTKEVCGDYPAVFSVDFAQIMDDRYWSSQESNAIRRKVILEARERGEVITACCHLNNPLTNGDSWDNSNNDVVKNILTEGTPTRAKFISWLDRLAVFALNLKDKDGNLIPVIFRPFHEHTQTWSWWGSKCTTNDEFIGLWKMTIEYLRDKKGVHNFIYAISPQMDQVYAETRERLLFRWPGDEYVDFIGMDCYHGTNTDAFNSNLKHLSTLSREKNKPCGVTETGKESFEISDYWTRCLLTPLTGKRISLVVMWRNKYVSSESDKHFFSVYPGHVSAPNFIIMYNRDASLFSNDLPDMYTLAEGVVIK
ncbi:glycoside hydrolase family 26 protein [Gaoshiqia sp. Z1-71]|uniref:glycoside hydrolase family 26 protein n=1 Tax=Gaoshiqia hydrogeniformans TaxID=3290090 RepID=UPI003BF7E24C